MNVRFIEIYSSEQVDLVTVLFKVNVFHHFLNQERICIDRGIIYLYLSFVV